ncbi:hypothetical protein N8H74_23335 [Pseudomonas sp. B2M1-30]|uniref:Uncharacterized protein n=1 Tax=Pseudomonas koreensis TaxID=198620 RepID=A0A9X3BEB3_9PSED|nr:MULTISPECIES: hypothetical protein [Pseudomonas]MBV4475121.1 hypothetical protein [Pseudomonas botevensis]MCU0121208.1 hypothetical protein [Pseudomonas sp. B2M1-30]MCU7250218.1 hypothetical protein [Pseudomonas koreensis]MCU7261062.1 hypothetical protein [Pseudomonas koreensis]
MNNKTIRWTTNLMMGMGTGFMVTGAAAFVIGNVSDADTIRTSAAMTVSSFFVIAASFAVALLEDKS